MGRLLSRFSLKIQIGSLIALAGAILCVCFLVLWVGQVRSDRAEAQAATELSLERAASTLDGLLLNARRHEKDFLLRRDSGSADRHAASMRQAHAALDALEAPLGPADPRHAQIAEVRRAMTRYGELFGALVASETRIGLGDELGLMGDLRKTVHSVEANLREHDDLRLLNLALMMRRSEKDFLARQDSQYADDLSALVAEFDRAVQSSRVPPGERPALIASVAAYHQAFKAVAEAKLANLDTLKSLSESYATLDPVVDALTEQARKGGTESQADAVIIVAAASRATTTAMAVGFVVLVMIGVLVARSIYRPINAMTGVMGELAADRLSVSVPFAERRDEIGGMARSVAHFKDQLIRVRQLEADQETQKRQAEADRLAAMRKMADAFEGSVGKVIESVTSAAAQLEASSGQMAGAASETSAQATTVASAAQQASANVQTVASATEELASSIREISHQVERSQAVSMRACEEAGTTTDQVRALSDNVGRIGEVVKLITDIASQTNLLALNATIEAARAGEAGKGFAVVAGEVKALANQTARATSEIAAQIKAVQDGTDTAVHAIAGITKVIGEMGEVASAVAAAVQEQSAATAEIARNVEQAAAGTAEVTANIVAVEQAARETGGAAEQIRDSAGDLSQQAEFLRGEVGRFLTQVRADKKDMVLVHWDESLLTGSADIDRDHQAMFEQINDFYRHMMAGEGGKAAIAALSHVTRTMDEHFAREEALMARAGYPGLAGHRAAHRAFSERIAHLRKDVEDNREGSGPALFEYLSSWLDEHIHGEDGALAAHLRSWKAAA